MGVRHNLKHSIINILKHNRDGSRNTQATRKKRLMLVADQLVDEGYQLEHVNKLKYKHVQHLVKYWLNQGLSPGTIKNRMTDLRWVTQKLGKHDLIPANNYTLDIPRREYVTNKDKSIILIEEQLSKIQDSNIKLSLILQQALGLRRGESIKIRINQAVVNDQLHLQGSWCKNGRARVVKIQYAEQWEAIKLCKAYVGNTNHSLIPIEKTYYQQLKKYENELINAGINKAHGLRHAYAQRRYQDLTGRSCAARGGLLKQEMTEDQLRLDKTARQVISIELGHERLELVAVYCGK